MVKKVGAKSELEGVMEEVRKVAGEDDYTVEVTTNSDAQGERTLRVQTTVRRSKFA